jgi:Ca-activated chloride channel family protein
METPTRRTESVVKIERIEVNVRIIEQVATTTLEIFLDNPSPRRLEAQVLLPVPDDSAIRGFDFQGAGSEPSAQLLPKHEARRIYDEIVSRSRDPALLEFVDLQMIRSSVFPVEPHGKQKIRLVYEHLCSADGDRFDYVLPRSEAIDYSIPWQVQLEMKTQRTIATIYSPSHHIDVRVSESGHIARATLQPQANQPGSFRLSVLLADKRTSSGTTPSATLMAYPDPQIGGGYFLLLAGVPRQPDIHDPSQKPLQREVTLVLDRSGSMAGEKIKQVRSAALQIFEALGPEESFNVIAYNESVDSFSHRPVRRSTEVVPYLQSLQARGGTNIHDALLEALRQPASPHSLPIVLFLTDGRPTIGQTNEKMIRDAVAAANTQKKRLFTFGVGLDVNSPLLEHLASQSRGTSTFVLPEEDLEVKVSRVFERMSGPLLAEPRLTVVDPSGTLAPGRTRELIPAQLPDLFSGDQLAVLGQYVGEKPLTFRLSARVAGEPSMEKSYQFTFDLDQATTRNSFVPRLWAQRKIGLLVDAIRSSGADERELAAGRIDPRLKELVDEIVRLSTEFGVLTEYTAFLAREGTDLSQRSQVLADAWNQFDSRARKSRVGKESINQEMNSISQKGTSLLNYDNAYWDGNLQRAQVTNVQQVADRAYFQKSGRWIDSRLLHHASLTPSKAVELGSPEYRLLVEKLAGEHRQGSLMLSGDIVLIVDDEPVLVRNY